MPTRASIIAALLISTVVAQQPTPSTPAGQNPVPAPKVEKPQEPAAAPAPAAPSQDAAKPAPIAKEKLEQLVAPIALYNDGLLAQVLMASTYPLEIVEAARWQQKNTSLKGEALEKAMKDKDWDPSVKSICGLPTVLKQMNDNLEWTQDLGDAFLADQNALMETVQDMRKKAFEAGNLKTTKEQTVEQREDKIIVIQAADPEVVYVPTYYPTAVYGSWYYPSYYYPAMYPPYRPVYPAFTFAVGVAWGAAVWGNCNWGGGNNNVNIDIDRTNNFNGRTGNRPAQQPGRGTNNKWQHDPSHRKGVGYRDSATAKQYGGSGTSNRVTRDQARGYGSSSGAARPSAGTRPTAGTRPSAGTRPTAGTRPSGQQPQARPGTTTPRAQPRTTQSTGQRTSSFSGARSSSTTRASSSRGATSRGTSSGGSRGGSRGGGGRGGGRGR